MEMFTLRLWRGKYLCRFGFADGGEIRPEEIGHVPWGEGRERSDPSE